MRRALATCIWLCLVAAQFAPMIAADECGHRCACVMACCRLHSESLKEQMDCHQDTSVVPDCAMSGPCARESRISALVTLPKIVIEDASMLQAPASAREDLFPHSVPELAGFILPLLHPPLTYQV